MGRMGPSLSLHSPSPVVAPGAAQLMLIGSKRDLHPPGCPSVWLAALSKEASGMDNTKQLRISKCTYSLECTGRFVVDFLS